MICPRCKGNKIGQMEVICQACQKEVDRIARERNIKLDNMVVTSWTITRKPQRKK